MLFGLQMETLWNIIIKVFDFILDFKITLILDQFKKEYHILYFHDKYKWHIFEKFQFHVLVKNEYKMYTKNIWKYLKLNKFIDF